MTDLVAPVNLYSDELRSFLNPFNFKLITVALLPHKGISGPLPQGKYFYKKDEVTNLIRAFTLDEFYSDEVQLELQKAQMQKWGVYFTINEGDGLASPLAKEGDLNCGKKTNIKTLRSLCIDTDTADAKLLMQKLTEIKFLPHIVTETRPGRYHLYFLIEPVPYEGTHAIQWEAMQMYLASLVSDLDQSMKDASQLLRLPGFFNFKGDTPYRIKRLRQSPFDLIELDFSYKRLEAHKFDPNLCYIPHVNGNGNGHYNNGSYVSNGTAYNRFTPPEGVLKEGNRRTMITRYMEHLMENVLPLTAPDYDYWYAIDAFIRTHIASSEQKDFLEGGDRRQNLQQYFTSQLQRRIELKKQKESQLAIKQFEHKEAVSANRLHDDFYLNFPGDLGQITREIHEFAPHISLEICFAGALLISGAMKAETFRFAGFWPLINGIIVAGPGAGKSTVKGVIESILGSVGLLGRYPRLLDFAKTAQMLHLNLYSAGGVATTIVDEAGEYLTSIKNKYSHSGTQELKKYYKEATTGPSHGVRLSPGGAVVSNYPPISNGFLSVWLMVQPEKFKGSLTMEDMSDGFLPRFLVFRGYSNFKFGEITRGEGKNRQYAPSVEMRVWLESYGRLMEGPDQQELDTLLEQVRAQVMANHGRGNPTGAIREAQRDAVYRARSEARLISCPKVNVQLSEEAGAAYDAYMLECQNKVDGILAEGDTDPQLIIYARLEEMINRLVCNACGMDGIVSLELMEALILFHKFQTERFFSNELEDMTRDRDLDATVTAVLKAVKKKGEPVTGAEIRKAFKSTSRPRNLDQILMSASKSGLIWSEEREHKRTRGKKIVVYRPAESEELITDL